MTSHFKNWLNSNGYGKYGFDSDTSYGGKSSDSDEVTHEPVIMLHGMGDIGAGWGGGYTTSIEYFIS